MATLAGSFMADLDDLILSDNDESDNINVFAENRGVVDIDHGCLAAAYDDNHDHPCVLQNTQRYANIMKKLLEDEDGGAELVGDCIGLSVDIGNEIETIHKYICHKHGSNFQELQKVFTDPIDYARAVKEIGNEVDLTQVDLKGLLPSAHSKMEIVCAALTPNIDRRLPEELLQKVFNACDRIIALDSAAKRIVQFLECRMCFIAPNLSAVVGTAVAANLIVAAGGLSSLGHIPACNVLLLGANKRKHPNLAAASTSTLRIGYIEQTEVFKSIPAEAEKMQKKASRLLANKSTLAARADSLRADPTGSLGRSYLEEIIEKIKKQQERPPARQSKSLPVPDCDHPKKKKRGGRRLRKMKERYAITDMQKLANRMQFGVVEESSLGDGLGIGFGMLGHAGNGKLRVSAAASGRSKLAVKIGKKKKKKKGQYYNYNHTNSCSGLTSCLAFTPVQGIELPNPQAHCAYQLATGTQSTYFSETGTFSKIRRSA